MVDLFNMKKLPPVEIIDEIAIELGVDSSFVEKDWFATQILSEIAQVESPEIIFTGGTSLSKGYNLIKRFSEDLDFRIITSEPSITRGDRKNIRGDIISKIRNIPDISIVEDSLLSQNSSKFFSFNIIYPQTFAPSVSLRPHLKLEFCFENYILKPEYCDIRSFITHYSNSKSDIDCRIKTISPIEIAADKFSALLWRINIHDRGAEPGTTENDPTVLRHLHDLSSLFNVINNSSEFQNIVHASFERDRGRKGSDRVKSLKELSQDVFAKLTSDPLYSQEYAKFVAAMSYAPADEQIHFNDAVMNFNILSEQIT